MMNFLLLLKAVGLFVTPLGRFMSAVALEEVCRTMSEPERGNKFSSIKSLTAYCC